jgi:ribosomal protein S4E
MAGSATEVSDGDACVVIAGTHAGKTGRVQDKRLSKTGHATITVLQDNGVRFKTLARNVEKRTAAPPRAKK